MNRSELFMPFTRRLGRRVVAIVTIAAAALFVFLLLNVGGWRARILARLFRVDNRPVVVPAPSDFSTTGPSWF